MKNLEVALNHPKKWTLGFYITKSYNDDYQRDLLIINALFISIYLILPTKLLKDKKDGSGYGFYLYQSFSFLENIVFLFGEKQKYFEFFWIWKYSYLEILDFKENVVYAEYNSHNLKSNTFETYLFYKEKNSKIFDFTYTLSKDTIDCDEIIQKRKAKVCIQKRYWKRKYLPFLKKSEKYIDITFDKEVGEKTGTYKGGIIQCSYEMQPHETPEITLKRMSLERKL